MQFVLKLLNWKHSLDVIFSFETKLVDSDFDIVKRSLSFENYLFVSCIYRKGGLALLWHNNLNINILNFPNILIILKLLTMLEVIGDSQDSMVRQ